MASTAQSIDLRESQMGEERVQPLYHLRFICQFHPSLSFFFFPLGPPFISANSFSPSPHHPPSLPPSFAFSTTSLSSIPLSLHLFFPSLSLFISQTLMPRSLFLCSLLRFCAGVLLEIELNRSFIVTALNTVH